MYALFIFSQAFVISKGHATYTCPITNVTLKEHKLSKENNVIKLKDSTQNPDEVFNIFKQAITKIRNKVSDQLNEARNLRNKSPQIDNLEKIEKKEALIGILDGSHCTYS